MASFTLVFSASFKWKEYWDISKVDAGSFYSSYLFFRLCYRIILILAVTSDSSYKKWTVSVLYKLNSFSSIYLYFVFEFSKNLHYLFYWFSFPFFKRLIIFSRFSTTHSCNVKRFFFVEKYFETSTLSPLEISIYIFLA